MVLVEKWPFFAIFFFRQYRTGNCLLRYSRTKKTLFYAIKTISSKKRKIKIFSTDSFDPKRAIFPPFFSGNRGLENVFYDILERKNGFLGYKNNKFKKSKNWDFSERVNPWVSSKNGHFSNFFLGNIVKEIVFYGIVKRKNAFLGYKNNKLKKSKN